MENDTFVYNYSAKEQAEIQNIRQKYLPKEEDKLEQLRRLDSSVSTKATVISIIVGVVGALIMGIGMCCTMVWDETLFIPGVVVGIIGIALIAAAYPLYNRTVKKERQRIAPEVLRLTEELLK